MGFRSWRYSSISTPNINEASSKDLATPLQRNAIHWSVWRGQEEEKDRERDFLFFRRVTSSNDSLSVDSAPYNSTTTSNLFRTASVPDVVGGNLTAGFSSITITARRTAHLSASLSQEMLHHSCPTQPVKALSTPEPFRSRALSTPRCTMKASTSQPDLYRQNPVIVKTTELRQRFSATPEAQTRGPGKRTVQVREQRFGFREAGRNRDVVDSFKDVLSPPSYRSCIHIDVPLRSASTFIFLNKAKAVSLQELEDQRATKPTLYRSTLSLRLSGSSYHRWDRRITKTDNDHGKSTMSLTSCNKWTDPESCLGHSRGPLSKQWGHKVHNIAPVCGVKSKADDSDIHQRNVTSGLLSFRGPGHSYSEADGRNGNADETVCSTQSNFRHTQPTCNVGPVNLSTSARLWWSREDKQGHGCPRKIQETNSPYRENACYYHSRLMTETLESTHRPLSLKEALELFRPDFISRSQGRVRRLEQRARTRRALQDSDPDLVQGLGDDEGRQKRNCTTPHPLSDNLFKPRERSISGREMQRRSRRIYNKLPEVTKRKEEEKKKAVSQTNRLRAELFKKRLLDQILQR